MSNREKMIMQATAYLDRARMWGKALEDREAARQGVPLPIARKTVARKTGIAPGTLETLRVGRLKAIAVHVYERLQAAVIADLEAEMGRLQHELTVARQAGVDPRSDEIVEVETHLARARAALGREA
jgi:hypothetical protein